DEENNREDSGDSAGVGETFYSEELFPIDARGGGARKWDCGFEWRRLRFDGRRLQRPRGLGENRFSLRRRRGGKNRWRRGSGSDGRRNGFYWLGLWCFGGRRRFTAFFEA